MDLKINEKKKTNIISCLFTEKYEDYDNSVNNCMICFNPIKDQIKLDCNHSFCYQCLLESYKGNKCNFYTKSHRICPYCRHPGKYLPLQDGSNPIKGIHREYGKKKKKEFKKCKAVLKSGVNKGQVCGCRVKDPKSEFCGRHKNKTN